MLVGCPMLVFLFDQEARQTMVELRRLIRTAEQELPDTAAAVRLSGLELSDAIEEVSLLRYCLRLPHSHGA